MDSSKKEITYHIYITNGKETEWYDSTNNVEQLESICNRYKGPLEFIIKKLIVEENTIGSYSKENGLNINNYNGFNDD